MTVGDVRRQLVEHMTLDDESSSVTPTGTGDYMKLIYKGKILKDDVEPLRNILLGKNNTKRPPKIYRIMATGASRTETETINTEIHDKIQQAEFAVRDDLTEQGQRKMHLRKLKGQQVLQKASQRANVSSGSSNDNGYGFGRIDTLPNLPDEVKAREILTSLANDPGVKACMAKHRWKVPILSEMYPEGKVGQSEVCVMGLNRNKGAQIELRIRTDDLKGFRKMLSIREVLYHELAHNVHSEHNGDFFQLMRQIKKECLEMDWTQGSGTADMIMNDRISMAVEGGTYRLGGGQDSSSISHLSPRELARRAAIQRLGAKRTSQQCYDCNNDDSKEDKMDES
ncbi:MAG: hypothetical protein SGILL_006387 [Bacillariaceae sp.]